MIISLPPVKPYKKHVNFSKPSFFITNISSFYPKLLKFIMNNHFDKGLFKYEITPRKGGSENPPKKR